MLDLSNRLSHAKKAFFVHLLASAGTAGFIAALIFLIWYPWPFDQMLGGAELFWLVVSVDVICGPLLTLILWNPAKPRRELLSDMAIVVLVQVMALAYGVYTVAVVRPVHIVFETDRFRLVSASEIDSSELANAPKGLEDLPWLGPTLLSLRDPKDNDELIQSIELSIAGKEPSLRPDWWQPFEKKRGEVLKRSKSLSTLYKARPEYEQRLRTAVLKTGMMESDLLWLPLTSSRSLEWVVLIDRHEALPRGYINIDGFIEAQ